MFVIIKNCFVESKIFVWLRMRRGSSITSYWTGEFATYSPSYTSKLYILYIYLSIIIIFTFYIIITFNYFIFNSPSYISINYIFKIFIIIIFTNSIIFNTCYIIMTPPYIYINRIFYSSLINTYKFTTIFIIIFSFCFFIKFNISNFNSFIINFIIFLNNVNKLVIIIYNMYICSIKILYYILYIPGYNADNMGYLTIFNVIFPLVFLQNRWKFLIFAVR